MSRSTKSTSLFSEFPPVPYGEWIKAIQKDLKGSNYTEKLLWETGEGIEALPFYRQEDVESPDLPSVPRSSQREKNNWEICQPVFEQGIEAANKSARQAVEQGAEALQFELHIQSIAGMPGGDLEGTAIQNQKDFNDLLEGIAITETGLHFDSGMASPVLIAMLHNRCRDQNVDASKIRSTFLYDPYAFVLARGQLPKPEENFIRETRQMAAFCGKVLPHVRCLGVDARIYHNAGATLVQELGFALATGSEYLAKLTGSGLSADEIAPHIHFNFSIGSNYFLEIAKFRAARLLWKTIVEAYKPEKSSSTVMYLHGTSSRWNKTTFAPYTNLLRTTTEGMAGAVAGCDSITLDPFDLTHGQHNEFSGRLARNTQIILKKEAWLDLVIDPSAGSYYIEQLTDKIVRAAWEYFQEVEQQGGMFRTLRGGYIQTVVEESRKQRDESIATRERVFVGTSQHPHTEEDGAVAEKTMQHSSVSLKESGAKINVDYHALIESLSDALQNGAQVGDLIPGLLKPGKQDIRPIRPYRGTQAFEVLRMATEQHESTPKVLILPMGNKKMHKARSAFSANFFSYAGYEIEDPPGFESVEEAVQAVKNRQPDITVLCNADKEDEQLAPQICAALDSVENRPLIVLAGDPEEHADRYKKAGVDAFIYEGCNVLEMLQWFQRELGVITENG